MTIKSLCDIINTQKECVVIMHIEELTIERFSEYSKKNPLCNYMQSTEYARFMGENHYSYDYIGLVDEFGTIHAASLILIKKIGFNMRYGYAPKGFLINYYDSDLVKKFIKSLKEFYEKKNVVFIKINPEIVVGEVDSKTLEISTNANNRLKKELEKIGFNKLKDNLYFESMEPRFNAYIDLKNSKYKNYSKTNRNKINNAKRKGLYFVKASEDDISLFEEMSTNYQNANLRKLYNIFSKNDNVDLMVVKINFEEYIKVTEKLYEEEENRNNLLNEILHRSNKKSDLNKKMASDVLLVTLKNEIIKATDNLKKENDLIVAGALVIKYGNRAHVFVSDYDKKLSYLNANYYLYNELIEYYKDKFDYLDMGGISGDFSTSNPYYGLNRFKMGFNPHIYEYIGEMDLVLNKLNYEYLLSTGKLAQEFNKDEF